ncbi:chitin deacetylase [Linnemannia gamsii]|uniref:Chitin deacetylase n=1 Tax=Linnemannia gamsii TaxID=64522 RepID=A0A9P6UQI5_9FUNG|nr:chitin deacetylase [Linnemannia gamsii]
MPMIAAQAAAPAAPAPAAPAASPAAPAAPGPATSGPNANTGPVTWADFLTSCQTPGQVALTYSEGPSEATMEMLETLKEAQATVTFFTNATWLQYMQYAGVTRHAHLDGMTYRLPSDTSTGHTDEEIKQDIAHASRTIQDLIGVYPKYMKIHESNLKDSRLLNLVKSMGYTLVGFNMDEYDYKYNTAATSSQIAEVFNAMFTKQMDAYGRKASYVVAGYDVPTTGAASGLPKVINTIQAHGYDMVRLDGCTNDKTPYKKDPILNNGFVGDAKSFGAAEYKHGQKSVNYTPGGNQQSKGVSPSGGNDDKSSHGSSSTKSAGSRLSAVASIMAIIPALAIAYLL